MLLCIFTWSVLFRFDLSSPFWQYVNYPGLELWKFLNLMLLIGVAFYLHHRFGRPVREALRSRGESIKRDLLKAQQERDQALAKLGEVESRFANLDAEITKLRDKAKTEAEVEKQRITDATGEEIAKTREQAKREIEAAGKVARHELRRFAAAESVRMAEELLAKEMKPEDDIRLTKLSVQELGGTRP